MEAPLRDVWVSQLNPVNFWPKILVTKSYNFLTWYHDFSWHAISQQFQISYIQLIVYPSCIPKTPYRASLWQKHINMIIMIHNRSQMHMISLIFKQKTECQITTCTSVVDIAEENLYLFFVFAPLFYNIEPEVPFSIMNLIKEKKIANFKHLLQVKEFMTWNYYRTM